MNKDIGKNISKSLDGNIVKVLIMLNNLQQIFKVSSERAENSREQ